MPRNVFRSPRLERKRRTQRLKRALLGSLLGVGIVGLLLYALFRPEFRIRTVAIDGEEALPRDKITSHIKSGIEGTYFWLIPKAHTFLFPKKSLEAALLRAFPAFSRVEFTREGLSGVRASVVSRSPYAMWCEERECFLLDETGVAFAPAPPEQQSLYYRFVDSAGATSTALARTVVTPVRLRELVSLAASLDALALTPLEFRLERTGELTVLLRGGARLLFPKEGPSAALPRLETLLSEKGLVPRYSADSLLGVDYIDLRYGNKIYFK